MTKSGKKWSNLVLGKKEQNLLLQVVSIFNGQICALQPKVFQIDILTIYRYVNYKENQKLRKQGEVRWQMTIYIINSFFDDAIE